MDPVYHASTWEADLTKQPYPTLSGKLKVDVVIIGGGITGLTAAALLKAKGKSVAVVEAVSIGSGTSGSTSAHLSTLYDHDYSVVEQAYDTETTQLVADGMVGAIALIERLTEQYAISCEFKRVPGYLFSEKSAGLDALVKEQAATRRAGLNASKVGPVPLPFPTAGGFQVQGQARFHPLKYLQGLAAAVDGGLGQVFEHSRVEAFTDAKTAGGPCVVCTAGGEIEAEAVVIATHTPLGLSPVQMQLAPVRSYIVTFSLDSNKSWDEGIPDALYCDTDDPYHYIRLEDRPEGRLVIVGGADRKTAHGSEAESFRTIEAYARQRFPVAKVIHEWSGQYYDPADHLPYVGKSPVSRALYVATGFSGDGLTLGSLAGLMLSEQVSGGTTAFDQLFTPSRLRLAGLKDLLSEGADIAKYMVKDHLPGWSEKEASSLQPGEGAVLSRSLQKIAAYRDESGELRTFSAVCPHMKAVVHWNPEHKSFDCPCHGSRFDTYGQPLEGPALSGLTPEAPFAKSGKATAQPEANAGV